MSFNFKIKNVAFAKHKCIAFKKVKEPSYKNANLLFIISLP